MFRLEGQRLTVEEPLIGACAVIATILREYGVRES